MQPTFLVVVDLSAAARRTAHLAAQLAAAIGGRLVLVPAEAPLEPAPLMGLEIVPPEYYAQQAHTEAVAIEA